MSGLPEEGVIRVKALQPRRFRAGLEFGRTSRELTTAELGDGIEGLSRLITIAEDPLLSVILVIGDEERPIGPAEIGELRAFLEAGKLRVDPANPPPPITELLQADTHSEGDGPAQGTGTDTGAPEGDEASSPQVLQRVTGSDTAPAASQPAGEQSGSPAAEPVHTASAPEDADGVATPPAEEPGEDAKPKRGKAKA